MITCTNCNAQLEDGTKFCESCGNPVEEATETVETVETVFCPQCGQQTSSEFAFCQQCGGSLAEEATTTEESAPVEESVPAQEGSKKFNIPNLPFKLSKKLVTMAAAGVAILLIVILLISAIASGGEKNYALYIRDGEIFYSDFSRKDPLEVTSKLMDGDVENSYYARLAQQIGMYGYAQMTKDGKKLFFVDKLGNDDGVSLYYRYVNKPKKEAEKLASDVSLFKVNEAGNKVTYLDSDGKLYQHNLKDKEKIASDVSEFDVTDDGKKVIFINDEDTLYYQYVGKDKEKIASDVSELSYVTEDYKTVYFISDGNLYKAVLGKDKEKLASDVESVVKVYESGEIYYTKSESEKISLMDYVTDDMKEADKDMKEPEYPEYPSRPYYFEYDSEAEYQAAYAEYEKAYEEYEEAKDKYYEDQELYWEKESRDELREELKEAEMESESYTLCYYNGKKETVLTESYEEYSYEAATDKAVMLYSAYNQSDVKKVKLSEVKYYYEVENMVEEALYSSTETYVAIGGKSVTIDVDDVKDFDMAPDGTEIYYVADASEKDGHGDLYKMEVSGSKVKKAEKYDSDVYSAYYVEEQLVYFKDVDEEGEYNYVGELYINKKKADSDVLTGSVKYNEDAKSYVYYTDYDSEDDCGTLKVYKSGKAREVASDVKTYTITPAGEILYLSDYSTKNFKGDMYLFKGKKSKKIDEDVSGIIPVYQLYE